MIKQRSNLILPKSLYAIGNVKDELNLHTRELTHRIGKIVFDGTENWLPLWGAYMVALKISANSATGAITILCSHFVSKKNCDASAGLPAAYGDNITCFRNLNSEFLIKYDTVTTKEEFKQFLANEYAAGHPVTVWYVLAEPTTETITVPEGLSGIIEGYLIQDGTPSPQNPIYPTSCDSVDMWNEVMYRQYGVNETLSPIPTTVFSQGDGIDSCTVYGNTTQNGTPAPTDPIDVIGVGENIISLGDYVIISNSYYLIISSGTLYDMFQNLKTGSTYRLSWNYTSTGSGGVENSIRLRRSDGTVFKYIGRDDFIWSENDKNAFYDIITYFGTNNTSGSMSNFVCETEYHIQLNVDSQITNIYLGEVQTTRNIIKYELTGKENWIRETGNTYVLGEVEQTARGYANALCTHYVLATSYSTLTGTDGTFSVSKRPALFIHDENFTAAAQLKAYLQQQYAAGTPVTIYYVLATPQTTTLNEPLMKIGDYADSVTYSSNIPTTYGQNDITTDTQIKPSKLDITYNALRRAKVYKNDRWILNPSIDWSQTLKISDLQSKKIKEMEGEYIGYNIHT